MVGFRIESLVEIPFCSWRMVGYAEGDQGEGVVPGAVIVGMVTYDMF